MGMSMFTEIYVALQAGQVLHQRQLEEAAHARRGWFAALRPRRAR
jgi:hypothetical protein